MRLFTAVLFDEERKDTLFQAVERLKENARGTFTDRENLHLTVNFIGETDRITEVEKAMLEAVESTSASEFTLSIKGLGKFKRREGDIYWIGVEKNSVLWKLQKELTKRLVEAGFPDIDDREYTPHLTLGRKVLINQGFQLKKYEDSIPSLQMSVRKVSLMKSERIKGKMVYTEIFHVDLI